MNPKTIAILAICLIIGVAFVDFAGIYDIPGLNLRDYNPAIDEDEDGNIQGIVIADVAASDSLEITQARTVGTNLVVTWYARRQSTWVKLGTGDDANLNINAEDANTVYASVSIPSGQAFYVDYAKTEEMNSRASDVQFTDVAGDNVDSFVFAIDLTGIPYASSTAKHIMPCFNIYLLTYDSTYDFGSGGEPADISGAGTTKVTKYIEWYTELVEKKAIALSKVTLMVNVSDVTTVELKNLNVPGISFLAGSSFEQTIATSSITWTYDISNKIMGADMVKLTINALNKQEYTTVVDVNLDTGEFVNFTLTLYFLDSAGDSQSVTDAVVISA